MRTRSIAAVLTSLGIGIAAAALTPSSLLAKDTRHCNNGVCWIAGGSIVCQYKHNWQCTFTSGSSCSSGECGES